MLILDKTRINILVDVHFLIPTFQALLIHINKVGNRINKVGHETTKWVNKLDGPESTIGGRANHMSLINIGEWIGFGQGKKMIRPFAAKDQRSNNLNVSFTQPGLGQVHNMNSNSEERQDEDLDIRLQGLWDIMESRANRVSKSRDHVTRHIWHILHGPSDS